MAPILQIKPDPIPPVQGLSIPKNILDSTIRDPQQSPKYVVGSLCWIKGNRGEEFFPHMKNPSGVFWDLFLVYFPQNFSHFNQHFPFTKLWVLQTDQHVFHRGQAIFYTFLCQIIHFTEEWLQPEDQTPAKLKQKERWASVDRRDEIPDFSWNPDSPVLGAAHFQVNSHDSRALNGTALPKKSSEPLQVSTTKSVRGFG